MEYKSYEALVEFNLNFDDRSKSGKVTKGTIIRYNGVEVEYQSKHFGLLKGPSKYLPAVIKMGWIRETEAVEASNDLTPSLFTPPSPQVKKGPGFSDLTGGDFEEGEKRQASVQQQQHQASTGTVKRPVITSEGEVVAMLKPQSTSMLRPNEFKVTENPKVLNKNNSIMVTSSTVQAPLRKTGMPIISGDDTSREVRTGIMVSHGIEEEVTSAAGKPVKLDALKQTAAGIENASLSRQSSLKVITMESGSCDDVQSIPLKSKSTGIGADVSVDC